jgi:hypothetical protein
VLIDVLLVVGNDGLGDSLTDGVDLGGVTTTGDTDADVDTSELVSANDQEGLVDLSGCQVSIVVPWSSSRPPRNHCFTAIGFVVVFGEEGKVPSAYLEAEDLGLDQGEGLAVNLDEALALL